MFKRLHTWRSIYFFNLFPSCILSSPFTFLPNANLSAFIIYHDAKHSRIAFSLL